MRRDVSRSSREAHALHEPSGAVRAFLPKLYLAPLRLPQVLSWLWGCTTDAKKGSGTSRFLASLRARLSSPKRDARLFLRSQEYLARNHGARAPR
jgi:hypothetical protein